MSVRSGTLYGWLGCGEDYLRNLRVLRYAVGSTLAMAVAMGLGWQLSFLTPVLALSFLATPAPRPTLKGGVVFVAIVAVACMAGLLLSRYLLPYPLVFVPFTGLVLLRLFYAKSGGAPPLLITWLLIAVLVIPLMALQSPALAVGVAGGIVFGAAMTIVMVWLAYGIFPDPGALQPNAVPAEASGAAAPTPTKNERVRDSLLSTVVVLPVMIVFFSFEFLSSLLVLVFIALLSMQPGFAKNFKAGFALIIGNVIGGVAAIIFYNLLVIVPEFVFLIALTLLAGLVFGARVFSGKKTAPLYGMAFSTVLLIIGSVTSSTGDAGAKAYTRIAQIMLAVAYVVAAFGVIERIARRREGTA